MVKAAANNQWTSGWPNGEAMGGIGYESDCIQRKSEEKMEHGNAA
jgi:hypothetical protein